MSVSSFSFSNVNGKKKEKKQQRNVLKIRKMKFNVKMMNVYCEIVEFNYCHFSNVYKSWVFYLFIYFY